jgi:hypothetical protein
LRVPALAGGVASAAVLGAAGAGLARRWRQSNWHQPQVEPERLLVAVFTWASVAILGGYGLLFKTTFWDRYLWPVAFGAAVLMLARASGRPPVLGAGAWLARLVAVTCALVVGVTAAVVTLNSDSYDAARWAAGQDLVKAGFPAREVDAGFEWVGSHATGLARPGRAVAGAPPYEQWYDQMFPGFRDCALVSGSRLLWPSLRLIRTVSYDEVAFARPEPLYLYAVDNSGCG